MRGGCPLFPWNILIRDPRNQHVLHRNGPLGHHLMLKSSLEEHLIKVLYLWISNVAHSEVDKKPLANEMRFRIQNEKEKIFAEKRCVYSCLSAQGWSTEFELFIPPIHSPHTHSKTPNPGGQIPPRLKEIESQDVCQYKALFQVLSFCKPNS